MTEPEIVDLLEKAMERHPSIEAAVQTGDTQLAIQDKHGRRYFINVQESARTETGPGCAKCKTPFDRDDPRYPGRARYRSTPYCRSCMDRCHHTEIADHRCVICA